MTADAAALLAAVRADPDADLPRLVFADYLDDTGDHSRAEYIRCAVEDARLAEDSPRRRELAFRCRELLDAHEDDWDEDGHADSGGFERGFITAAALDSPTDDDLQYAFGHPLRRLRVRGLGDRPGGLTRIPADNRLTTLDLTGNRLTAAGLRKLARVRRLAHLDTLVLSLNRLDDEAAAVLCDLGFYAGLRVLEVGGNPFSEAGRQRLAGAFGGRVLFGCWRHPRHLYPLTDDYFVTGFGHDHTQVMLFTTADEVRAVRFDHAGRWVDVVPRPIPGDRRGEATDQARDGLVAELGVEAAPVRMRRFDAGELVIDDYPHFADTLAAPHTPPAEREDAERWLDGWLADGQYRLDFGGEQDYWVDGDGEVTDT